jgi:flavin reductase (DIM6/NTAB) family NADH-FMN oxidoreductase RutF
MKTLEPTHIDFSKLDPATRYRHLIEYIVPRPIAFVATQNARSEGNLAPFSFFMGVASNPACIAISITPKRGGILKDTLRNILETGVFTVNGCTEEMVEPVHQTSADYEYGRNELHEVGLTACATQRIPGFYINESPWALECKLYQTMDIGERGTQGSAVLVLGEVLVAHQKTQPWKPLSRLGGAGYGKTETLIELKRPEIAPTPKR